MNSRIAIVATNKPIAAPRLVLPKSAPMATHGVAKEVITIETHKVATTDTGHDSTYSLGRKWRRKDNAPAQIQSQKIAASMFCRLN